MAWTLFISAAVLLALGVPVAFSLAAAALLAVALDDRYTAIVVLKEISPASTVFRCSPCRSLSLRPH